MTKEDRINLLEDTTREMLSVLNKGDRLFVVNSRNQEESDARAILQYLIYIKEGLKHREISALFGQNVSTATHAINRVRKNRTLFFEKCINVERKYENKLRTLRQNG